MKENDLVRVGAGVAMLLLGLIFVLPRGAAAFDLVGVFAKIDQLNCKGLSTDEAHHDEIIVRSLSETVAGAMNLRVGGVAPSPLKIVKDFDGCSPLLFKALVLGQPLPLVRISFIVAPRDSPVEFFRIELQEAQVQSMTSPQIDAYLLVS